MPTHDVLKSLTSDLEQLARRISDAKQLAAAEKATGQDRHLAAAAEKLKAAANHLAMTWSYAQAATIPGAELEDIAEIVLVGQLKPGDRICVRFKDSPIAEKMPVFVVEEGCWKAHRADGSGNDVYLDKDVDRYVFFRLP